MHWNRSRCSDAFRRESPHIRRSGLSLGLALLLGFVFVEEMAPALAPAEMAPVSCKPRPPYGVQLTGLGDARWNLVLSSAAPAGELVVWMWSEVDDSGTAVERQKVWAGKLDADAVEQVEVRYAPLSNARQVWACIETANQSQDPQAAAMRGIDVADGPAAASAPRRVNHVVTEDPVSGRRVVQFVGQGGVQ